MQTTRQSDWISTMEPMIRGLESESSRAQFPTPWLEKLLGVVNYDFSKEVVFFCVDCKDGLYPSTEFQEGAVHDGHVHFPTYKINHRICVHTAVMMSLDLDVVDVESISHSGHYYNYLHSVYRYFLDAEPAAPNEQHKCLDCAAPTLGPFVQEKTKYCCLECKSVLLCGDIKPSEQSSPPLPITYSKDRKPNDGPVWRVKAQNKSVSRPESSQGPHTSGIGSSVNKLLLVPADHEDLGVAEFSHFSEFESDHESHILGFPTDSGYEIPCHLHSDPDAEPIETTCKPLPVFELGMPSKTPSMIEYLQQQAPRKYLYMDKRLGVAIILATEIEERKQALCQGSKPRLDDGVLKRAAILFKSYIDTNKVETHEESYYCYSEDDEDLASNNEPTLELEEI